MAEALGELPSKGAGPVGALSAPLCQKRERGAQLRVSLEDFLENAEQVVYQQPAQLLLLQFRFALLSLGWPCFF